MHVFGSIPHPNFPTFYCCSQGYAIIPNTRVTRNLIRKPASPVSPARAACVSQTMLL